MSRPAGSKNKPKEIEAAVTFGSIPVSPVIERRAEPRYDLTLSLRVFRRHEKWSGQWELSKLDNDGKRTVIIDATSRQSVINMVNRQIMKMVIAG